MLFAAATARFSASPGGRSKDQTCSQYEATSVDAQLYITDGLATCSTASSCEQGHGIRTSWLTWHGVSALCGGMGEGLAYAAYMQAHQVGELPELINGGPEAKGWILKIDMGASSTHRYVFQHSPPVRFALVEEPWYNQVPMDKHTTHRANQHHRGALSGETSRRGAPPGRGKMPTLKLPGMIDTHVHLREPGASYKEGVDFGTQAALAGGVIGILDMPNTRPATTDEKALAAKQTLYKSKSHCDFGLFLGSNGYNLEALTGLGSRVAGLKIYLDNTYGDLHIQHPDLLERIWERWPGPGPICVHAESMRSLSLALSLTSRHHQRLHVCHISRAEQIALILAAKEEGQPVTFEVTPHHLFLTSEDAERLGPFGMMKPALATPSDRDALWQHLDDVDCIATDHAPHTRQEKLGADPPPGVPGVETALPLLLTAVDQGRLDLARLVELTYSNPLRIFPISPPADSWIEVDPDAHHQLSAAEMHSRCGWTPFEGTWVTGRILRTWVRGQIAFELGETRAPPGSGHDMVHDRSSVGAADPARPGSTRDGT